MEYMLIISLVALVVIAVLTVFGLNVNNYYNNTANELTKPLGG